MDTKTVSYSGATNDEAQRQYAADSAEAIGAGWVVENVGWDMAAAQPTLKVTYTRSAAPLPPMSAPPASQAPERSSDASVGRSVGRTIYLFFLAAVTVTLVVVGLILITRNEGALSCIFGGC